MLLLTICDDSYSDTLNEGLCDFVSSNTAEIVQMEIDLVEDSDCNLEFIFPRAFLKSHRREECCEVLRAIRDRLRAVVIYNDVKPLYQYVLYNIIGGWIEFYETTPEATDQINYKLPEKLKELIRKEIEEADFVIKCAEDIHEYIGMFFEDIDFMEDNIRALVELAIHRTELFELTQMSLEELDEYIEVMPIDVVEDYLEFRKRYCAEKEENNMSQTNKEAVSIVINGTVENSNISVNSSNIHQEVQQTTNKEFDYDMVKTALKEINNLVSMSDFNSDFGEKADEVKSLLERLVTEVEKKQNPGLIKAGLIKIKNLASGVTGSLIASAIFEVIKVKSGLP